MTIHGVRWLAIVLCAVALVAHRGAVAQDAWHTMTGPERAFTAELPAEPKYTRMELKSATGSLYTLHKYVLERGDAAFVVQAADYPSDVNITTPRISLQGGLDNAAKSMEGGKWASADWLTHQGLTAVDAVGERNGLAVRSFSVMKGRQIYSLTYAGPAGTARSADADRFVGSLRIGQ